MGSLVWQVPDLASGLLQLRQYTVVRMHKYSLVTPAGDQGVENFAVIRAENVGIGIVQGAIGAEGWHVEGGPIKGR